MVSRTWEFCGKIDEFITNHIFYNFEAFNKNKALFCGGATHSAPADTDFNLENFNRAPDHVPLYIFFSKLFFTTCPLLGPPLSRSTLVFKRFL